MSNQVLPIKHLSVRVPWHDTNWNGCVCKNVVDNSFCRILKQIDLKKEPDDEKKHEGDRFSENYLPPCEDENGAFLSSDGYNKKLTHAFQQYGNQLFKDFGPCNFYRKPYSFKIIPFAWTLKKTSRDDHASQKAEEFNLDYDIDLEKEIDGMLGFTGNTWVQHEQNQRLLLDTFAGCLKPKTSLIFIYAKHTPLSEPNERVIIGVTKVKYVGSLHEYQFPAKYTGHRSLPWPRNVGHTLNPTDKEGIVLPYHELLELKDKSEEEVNLNDFVAYAPDFDQFSYAAELVDHDIALDALFNIYESLKKASVVLKKKYDNEFKWLDNEIARLWDMRGAFPGLGPILAAVKIKNANNIAWEIEKYIQRKDGDFYKTNPWDVLDQFMDDPIKLGGTWYTFNDPTNKVIYNFLSDNDRKFMQLFSRCYLNNEQALFLFNNYCKWFKNNEEKFNNPYRYYEKTRFNEFGLSLKQVDKAFNPIKKIKDAFPLPAETKMGNDLDPRRVRAILIYVLEKESDKGHSLLPISDILTLVDNLKLDPECPVNTSLITSYLKDEFMLEELIFVDSSEDNPQAYLKLKRLEAIKERILQRINKEIILSRTHKIEHDWLGIVNNKFNEEANTEKEKRARKEKANALEVLCKSRFSVLIGPAGSGKTKLLNIFEEIPEIKQGGVVKIAPTGKARVRMGADAETLAQYLLKVERYDIDTGRYFINPNAPKIEQRRTIIVDEASMLSEDQLAALFDALLAVDRIILSGDHRQLPPIGTGRPFIDIIKYLQSETEEQTNIGFAELKEILRQETDEDEAERLDVVFSKCFSDRKTKYDIERIYELYSDKEKSDNSIRLEKWYDNNDLRQKLQEIIKDELGFRDGREETDFNLSLGGVEHNGYTYFNEGSSELKVDDWQIITPVNGFGYGVREVNKFIQAKYRQNFIELAINPHNYKRKIAKPKGSYNIVYGDKVINTRNSWWRGGIKPRRMRDEALNYFANGEIGIITGYFKGRNNASHREPDVEIAFSTQPGYSYIFKPYQLGENGNFDIELAYCITVHKSQGSGFNTVFFILPSKGYILSRELIYTALTRQVGKIIVLHQGEFSDFMRFTTEEFSESARRLTDLFRKPQIEEYNNKLYDKNYIHVTERGDFVISKNEVIIANLLYKYEKEGLISYSYEQKIAMDDGRNLHPDFTIEDISTGRRFYWEHLGMMAKISYREKWQKKLEAYKKNGFVLYDKSKISDDNILILSEENPNGGIDSQDIDKKIQKYVLGR